MFCEKGVLKICRKFTGEHPCCKCLPENLLREKGFWLFFGSVLFSMSSELRFVKWVRFFEQICIVKWVIFFAIFCWVWDYWLENLTAQKMKFPINDFFSKCDQIRRKLRIWWHLLRKSLMEKLIFVQCLEIKKNSENVYWKVWANIKKLYARNFE